MRILLVIVAMPMLAVCLLFAANVQAGENTGQYSLEFSGWGVDKASSCQSARWEAEHVRYIHGLDPKQFPYLTQDGKPNPRGECYGYEWIERLVKTAAVEYVSSGYESRIKMAMPFAASERLTPRDIDKMCDLAAGDGIVLKQIFAEMSASVSGWRTPTTRSSVPS